MTSPSSLRAMKRRKPPTSERAEAVPDDVITQSHLLRKEGILSERRGRYSDALALYGRALGVLDAAEDDGRTRSLPCGRGARLRGREGPPGSVRRGAHLGGPRRRLCRGRRRSRSSRTRLHSLLYSPPSTPASARRSERDEALAILEEVGDLVKLMGCRATSASRRTTTGAGTTPSTGTGAAARRPHGSVTS